MLYLISVMLAAYSISKYPIFDTDIQDMRCVLACAKRMVNTQSQKKYLNTWNG